MFCLEWQKSCVFFSSSILDISIMCYIYYNRAEDVTVTMYTAAYQRTADGNEFPNKVDTICDAVRQSLIDVDENR